MENIVPTTPIREIRESTWDHAYESMQAENKNSTLVSTNYFYSDTNGDLDYVWVYFLLHENNNVLKVTARVDNPDTSLFDPYCQDFTENQNDRNAAVLQYMLINRHLWKRATTTVPHNGLLVTPAQIEFMQDMREVERETSTLMETTKI